MKEMSKNALEWVKWAIVIFIGGIIGVILAFLLTKLTAAAMSVAFAFIFGLLIAVFYYKDKNLNKGEIRRSIAITFVVMYIVFSCFSLDPTTSGISSQNNTSLNFENNEFINNFHNAILVILAFYFGSRAFEVGMGARTRIRDWAIKILEIKKAEDMTTGELKEEMKKIVDKESNIDKLKEKIKKIIDME